MFVIILILLNVLLKCVNIHLFVEHQMLTVTSGLVLNLATTEIVISLFTIVGIALNFVHRDQREGAFFVQNRNEGSSFILLLSEGRKLNLSDLPWSVQKKHG